MRVVFITPASTLRRMAVYRWGSSLYGTRDAITGPLILAGIVRRAGHEVEAYEELRGTVGYERLCGWADVVCLYTMTSNAPRAYDIADRFHARGHARVLIGGLHASALPEEALAHADQVLVGEGENTILDVVEGRRTEPIVRCEPVCDLDAVPWPDYSVLKTPCDAADIMTSRGCPFRCSFCTTSRMFHPYRKRSVDSVMAEVRHCKAMGFQYMNFEDDNFTADRERAKEICRRIIAEHLQFRETFFFGRTDMASDPELLDLLAAANLNWVLIGIESLNQASLDEVDKHQSVEDIRRAGFACRDHGIQLIASIVLGIDTDTHEDIMRSVAFAQEIGASKLQPAILTPFPGTADRDRLEGEGRILFHAVGDWELYDMTNVTFQPRRMSPWRLQECFFEACDSFYDLPSALRIWRLFGMEYGLRRIWLAVATSMGVPLAHLLADHAPTSPYGRLKRAAWKYERKEGSRGVVGRDTLRTATGGTGGGGDGLARGLAALALAAGALGAIVCLRHRTGHDPLGAAHHRLLASGTYMRSVPGNALNP